MGLKVKQLLIAKIFFFYFLDTISIYCYFLSFLNLYFLNCYNYSENI